MNPVNSIKPRKAVPRGPLTRGQQRRRLVFEVLAAAALLAFCVSFIVRGWHERAAVHPVPGGVTTTGVVVEQQFRKVSRSEEYHPVIAFVDRNGARHVFTGPSNKPTHAFPVGTHVRVSYDPNNPAVAHDLDGGSNWKTLFVIGIVLTCIVGMLNGLWLVLGIRGFRRRRRARRVRPSIG